MNITLTTEGYGEKVAITFDKLSIVLPQEEYLELFKQMYERLQKTIHFSWGMAYGWPDDGIGPPVKTVTISLPEIEELLRYEREHGAAIRDLWNKESSPQLHIEN